jgi:PPOX class probable F420-dependent enzyme
MTYTQSPHMTTAEIDSLLKEPKVVARFCSRNADGTIHAAPVWFTYEDGKVLVATPERSVKARNVRRDGNVTVLVDVHGPPTRGVIVYGQAEIEDELDPMWGVTLFEKYVEREQAEKMCSRVLGLSKWVRVVVSPTRFASFDYGKDEKWKAVID